MYSRKCKNSRRNTKRNTKRNNKIKKYKSKKSRFTKRTQRGGFTSCSLATVQEPGFTIPAIGDVPGFSLSDSKGVINRPNCKTDTYQAMTPA